jgi:hypothetical protein
MMNRSDILLVLGALCIVASAFTINVTLGLFVAGVEMLATWFLLGESRGVK